MANSAVPMAKALGKKFSFTIVNGSQAQVVIALLAAFFNTLKIASAQDAVSGIVTNVLSYNDASEIVTAGYTCDAVLDDGTVLPGVVCTASNAKMTIRQFQNYIKAWGHTITDLVITGSNQDVFDQQLQVVTMTPLDGSAPSYINLGDHKDPLQTNQLKVEINGINMIARFDTLALLPIAAGRTVTITFRFV